MSIQTKLTDKQFSILRIICGENFEESNGGPVSVTEVCMASQYKKNKKQTPNLINALKHMGMVAVANNDVGVLMVTPTQDGLDFYQAHKNTGV